MASVIIAGHSYGAGSARDWAAKVTRMLGVRVVIAAGFERIHRTNLAAMGVLPIEADLSKIHLAPGDKLDVTGLEEAHLPTAEVTLTVRRAAAPPITVRGVVRVDNPLEELWVRAGGVLPYLARRAGQKQ